jgi:DNA-binding NarL/FixJ family response regulator
MSVPNLDPYYLERLTPREKDVIRAYFHHGKTALVAEAMCVSVKTVESHRRRIFRTLQVDNLIHMAILAIRDGWLTEYWERYGEELSPCEVRPSGVRPA